MKTSPKMLGCVRRGTPTEETPHTLEKSVIKVSVPEIFSELRKEGKVSVCLFPTRKQCDQLNEQMLASLDCPKKNFSFLTKWTRQQVAQESYRTA